MMRVILRIHLFNKHLFRIYFVVDTAPSTVDFTLNKEYIVHSQKPTVKWEPADELHGTGSCLVKSLGKKECRKKIIWEAGATTRDLCAQKFAPRSQQL